MKYTDTNKEYILFNGLSIPNDPLSRDYRKYVQPYIDEGGVVEEYQETVNPKMVGVEFDGVMCSATARDMFGLSAVIPYIKQGLDLPAFHFQNGNTLKLTQQNVGDFESTWIPFRASFFED